jgi:mono/diheme cytochrome c family protein
MPYVTSQAAGAIGWSVAMTWHAVAICFALLGAAATADAQQPAPTSTSAGVFTEEQAKKGGVAYNANCAACHGSELLSTDREVSNLTGNTFQRWIGKTVADLFEVTRDTMPPKDERSLDNQIYLDIVAYILRFNKIPAGSEELKPEVQRLRQITIAKPPG